MALAEAKQSIRLTQSWRLLMGKWLAEFQENTPETRIPSTDKTDTSCDLSVLSVPHQGVLEEKSIESELMALVSKACEGLSLSPDQFIRTMNVKEMNTIIKWEHREIRLKNLAKRLDDAIKDGVVDLIVERINK